MFRRITNHLRKFRRDEDGTIIAEAVTMFPTLFAVVIAMFVFFDAFRNQSINLKAAYTISDAISREQNTLDNNYIVNTWRLHRFLSNSQTLTRMQVSLIQYDEDANDYRVVWSESKGGIGDLTDGVLDTMVANNQIPVMPHEETLIVLQTSVNYTPSFTIGLGSFNFDNLIFTRPRFTPQLCFSSDGSFNNRVCPTNS